MYRRFNEINNGYGQQLFETEQKKKMAAFKRKWITAKNDLEMKIEDLEETADNCTSELESLKARLSLQTCYEEYDTACEYQYKLDFPQNRELVEKLLVDGCFAPIDMADKIVREFDQECIFRSDKFQKKKALYKKLSTISMVVSPFVFPQLLYAVILFFSKAVEYGFYPDFGVCLFGGYFIWAYSAIISIPIGFAIGFILFPKLISKALFGKEIPDEILAEQKKAALFHLKKDKVSRKAA